MRVSIIPQCKLSLVVAMAVFLTACATPSFPPLGEEPTESKVDLSQMYVRGIFNWWEADPAYLLSKGNGNTYSVSFELIADGQPYDFRLADQYWSPSKSCGATELTVVSENQSQVLYCAGDSKNLQFTPVVTGTYQLTVSRSGSAIELVINRQ